MPAQSACHLPHKKNAVRPHDAVEGECAGIIGLHSQLKLPASSNRNASLWSHALGTVTAWNIRQGKDGGRIGHIAAPVLGKLDQATPAAVSVNHTLHHRTAPLVCP